MSFYDIYNLIVMMLYGDTTPPTSTINFLQGSTGLIWRVYNRIIRDYNFWFMRAYTTWDTTAGIQTYGLPDLFKEIISIQFKKEGESYFIDPLIPLRLEDPFLTQWNENQDQVEYPEYYELVENNITIYPPPKYARTLHLIYWTFFSAPSSSDWVQSTSTSNALTENAGDIIAYLAASEYSLIMKEYDQSKMYNLKGQELLAELKKLDYRKRQAPVSTILYEAF